VEAALPMSVLMVASGFILVKATTVKTLMLLILQDFPTYKVSEEVQELNASKAHLTANLLDPKQLSASNLLAQVMLVQRFLPYKLAVRKLLVQRKVKSALVAMLAILIVLIQLNGVALLDKRSVLEDVWVEVLASMVFAHVIKGTRVKIAL